MNLGSRPLKIEILLSRSLQVADRTLDARQELLAWLNNLLQLNVTKVEQCGTGYACPTITRAEDEADLAPLSKSSVVPDLRQHFPYDSTLYAVYRPRR